MAMNLSDFLEKRKHILVIVSVILFTLIMGNNLYQFQKRRMGELEEEIEKEEVKNSLVREIVLLNEKFGSYEKRLPMQRDVSWLMRKVGQLVKDTQVEIVSLQPKALDRQVGYVRIPLEIKLKCNYHQLGGFLSKVESSLEFIRVDSLQLLSNREEEKTLTANLVVSTIYLEE